MAGDGGRGSDSRSDAVAGKAEVPGGAEKAEGDQPADHGRRR